MLISLLNRILRYRFHHLGFESKLLDLDICRLHFFQRTHHDASRHLVFIHGLGTSSVTWINLLPLIPSTETITCVDLPGYGYSKIKTGDRFFRIPQIIGLVSKFIQILRPLPLILIGHSLGGWLAARLAVNHPDLVKKLILINNSGIMYPGIEKEAGAFTIRTKEETNRLLHLMWFRYPWYFKPFTTSIFHSLRNKHVSEFVASIQEKDLLNTDFPNLSIPVDVIWGKEDKLISPQSLTTMKQLLPQLNTHFIPDCGHVPQLEKPRALALQLNMILSKNEM